MWKVAVFIIGLLLFCLIWLGPPSNQAKVRTQGYTLTSIGSDDNKQVERLMDFSSFHSAIRHDLHASPTIFSSGKNYGNADARKPTLRQKEKIQRRK